MIVYAGVPVSSSRSSARSAQAAPVDLSPVGGTGLVPKVTLETWRMTLAMLNPYLWGYLPGEEPVEGSVSTEILREFIRLAIKYEPKTPTLG